MSRRGLAEPKIEPTSCFSYIVSSNRFMLTLSTENGATAVCTTRPPFFVIASAGWMYSPWATPIVRITLSAIAPHVSSPTSSVASSMSPPSGWRRRSPPAPA